MLRRHAGGIEAMRSATQDKLAELETLYCAIIWDALNDRSRVLLLDDIDKLDTHSLSVLKRLAARIRTVGTQSESTSGHSAIVYTSRAHNVLGMGEALEAGAHREESPAQPSLLLAPLDSAAIIEIARHCLGSSLAKPVAALVVGELLLQLLLRYTAQWCERRGFLAVSEVSLLCLA
jgi:hypothetical protein